MTDKQIEEKALGAYPKHEFGIYIKENELKREGYIKALEEIKDLPKITGWVARDEDGSVWFHYSKPTRYDKEGYWKDESYIPAMEIYHVEFPDLKWESEPVKIELIIRDL